MSPEEVTAFKEKARNLESLETELSLLTGSRNSLELSLETEALYVKVEVSVRGTNTSIWLSGEMMKAVHLALSMLVTEEIRRVEEEIAKL